HRPSGTVVAIKTVRDEMAASSQRLLLDEAVAAAQMAHPNIVELLDVGRDEAGAMFLVMELVRGDNLQTWQNAFPGMRTVLRAFGEILDALATAHAAGIVHGDLKPANVLLTSDGHVKLTDFGVAHVIDPLRKEEKRRIQGTPFYMAPEQIVDQAAIGPATDLYAIGVMLYDLLGANEPYGEDTSIGAVIARKALRVEPFVPREGLALPPVAEFLITSLLDPDPRTRPRFAARVRDALAAIAVEMAESTIDGRVSSEIERAATLVSGPTHAKATTIQSAPELPHDTRQSVSEDAYLTDSGTNVSLRMLRPLPLVGRREQTERLLATARDVIAGHGTRVVLFSGRAGEGKTRLVRQGFAEVERTGAMLGAAASFDETIASAQVGLHACMTRLLGAPMRSARETLEGPWRWLARVPQPGVDFVRACAWLASEIPLEAKTTAEVAAQCLLAASRVFPIYLWLDDVAWSRDGAMDLVLRLLERDDARVLAVGTLRSGTAEHPAVREWLDAAIAAGARHEVLG
ncbi:MAG TPA: serine/threonine-protein kinase, partial [Polyangiaceae bacterium]